MKNRVLSDDVTKMIFLKLWVHSIVQNNLSETSSHAKYWLFSALTAEIWVFEVQIASY